MKRRSRRGGASLWGRTSAARGVRGPPFSAQHHNLADFFFFLLLQKEFRCLSSRDKGGRKCDEVCGGGADGGALPVALVARRGGGDAPVAAGSYTQTHTHTRPLLEL